MNEDINRLLMELERRRRVINHEVINPHISELTIDDLRPVSCMVASARARYIKAFFDLGACTNANRPTAAQFQELAQLRHEFEELIAASKAMESALQRGYLDVEGPLAGG